MRRWTLAGCGVVALGLIAAAGLAWGGYPMPWTASAGTPTSGAPSPSRPITPVPPPTGSTYVTVAFGDSVPYGGNCDLCTTYPQLVGQKIADHYKVKSDVVNLAVNGQKALELPAQLNEPEVGQTVANANLVMITDGANDLDFSILGSDDCASVGECAAPKLAAVSKALTASVKKVRQLNPKAVVVLTGYWNVSVDGPISQQTQSEAQRRDAVVLTTDFNSMVSAVATATGSRYVDLRTAFSELNLTQQGQLLADDGDHLSQAGHDFIARSMSRQLLR